MLIENRPGAGGAIGAEAVSRAAPDGNTLLMAFPDLFIASHLRKLNYDPLTSVLTHSFDTRETASSSARLPRAFFSRMLLAWVWRCASRWMLFVPNPRPDSSTMRARATIFCGVLPSPTSRSSVVRSLGLTYRHASMFRMPQLNLICRSLGIL